MGYTIRSIGSGSRRKLMSDKHNKAKGTLGEYGAQSIQVIEGLEAVRKRPAMYIGSTGPQGLHHLVYEIVDNSVDEALAGFCTNITVKLYTDSSCSVEDNGRGIPTGIHPTEGISAAQVALTKLHAGGKFDKESYKFSGGLHGVGVSVVNALSRRLELTIYQHDKAYAQLYQKGKPIDSLHEVGKTTKRGTLVHFWPDPEIFKESTDLSFDTLSARLRELAFLNKGLRITIEDERTNKSHEFCFEGGIISFVQYVNSKKTTLFSDVIYAWREDTQSMLEIAMQYNDSYGEQLFSFVNNINTVEGGTHVAGFKSALTKVCNKRGQEFGIIKEGESLSSEDVREGLVCVINLKIAEPQFEGQTKTKLGNNDIKGLVDSWTFSFLDTYFEEHPSIAKKILQKAQLAMHAREAARKARDLTRKKTILESMVLPGKLADCSNDNPAESELFIVEGDSAGGSAKQARDRYSQAILPLKGKILNVEKARFDKILSNDEIKSLIAAIGSGIGEAEFSVDKARYHKIILMTDADVDGAHIRTLLLTFFFRYMKPLIDKGYLYIAQPPLYKAKIGKKEQYLKDERAFNQFLFDWVREQASLTVNNKPVERSLWHTILDTAVSYTDRLDQVSHKFKLTHEQCYHLIEFLAASDIQGLTTEQLVNALSTYLTDYTLSITQEASKSYIQFKYLNDTWSVSTDFFTSDEAQALVELNKSLALLNNPWILRITDREKHIASEGILPFISSVAKISKPYMTVQRYKGLGEMNPEQLWETAMDATTRSLMQVSINDVLEADSWFDTLMGDDVSGRRDFIEKNGRFVKNLDV
jgi:DNA gyrase subunit B